MSNNQWAIGQKVMKLDGYPFPGEIRAVFRTKADRLRIVVEATGEDYAGMLHIFNPDQLVLVRSGDVE